jgi:hypothetical protein
VHAAGLGVAVQDQHLVDGVGHPVLLVCSH